MFSEAAKTFKRYKRKQIVRCWADILHFDVGDAVRNSFVSNSIFILKRKSVNGKAAYLRNTELTIWD